MPRITLTSWYGPRNAGPGEVIDLDDATAAEIVQARGGRYADAVETADDPRPKRAERRTAPPPGPEDAGDEDEGELEADENPAGDGDFADVVDRLAASPPTGEAGASEPAAAPKPAKSSKRKKPAAG